MLKLRSEDDLRTGVRSFEGYSQSEPAWLLGRKADPFVFRSDGRPGVRCLLGGIRRHGRQSEIVTRGFLSSS